MVLPGNPKGINKLADLTRRRCHSSIVSGGWYQVLLDWALKEEGIDPAGIKGYSREEYTHTSVAAAVKSGAADVGLGVLSAARALDLDLSPAGRMIRSGPYD